MNRSVRLLVQTVVTGIVLAPLAAYAQVESARVAARDLGAELACGGQ